MQRPGTLHLSQPKEGAPEIVGRAADPILVVHLPEDLAALLHWVANHSRLDWFWIEVAEQHHLGRPTPVAFTHETPLGRVHYNDEIGGTDHVGGRETRSMV